MRYVEYAARPPLNRWVHCYWVLEGAGSGAPEAILPDGRMELVVHFGDPFLRVGDDGSRVRQPRSFLVGQQRRFLRVEASGQVAVLGVRFRPGGASPFLGFPQIEAAGRTIAAEELWGRAEATRLEDQIADARSDAGQVARVESFLWGRLRERWRPATAVEAAVTRIFQSGGALSMDELAGGLGWSARQLGKTFRRTVGISPKLLSRIVRFQGVLARMRRPHGRRWAWTALECGYYDQAHLIRDFREFAGQSPAAYLGQDHPLAGFFVDGSVLSNTAPVAPATLAS